MLVGNHILSIMKLTITFLSALALILITSCEKVIHIDLDEADQKVVIEGVILNGDTIQRVRVTRTTSFENSTGVPTVDNAVVNVSDDLGNNGVFTSVGNGWYELSGYPGVQGRTYSITVTVEGQTYTATSQMPTLVPIDTLYVEFYPFGNDTFTTLVPAHFDPAGIANYYQFHVTKNGLKKNDVYLQDDQFTDGNLTVQPLFLPGLEINDTIIVTMFCIDKPVWTYFNQLSLNASNSTTPANPVSNFSGGCLGYFSARTWSTKQVIVGQ